MDLSDCSRQVGEHIVLFSKCDERLFSGHICLQKNARGKIYAFSKGERLHRAILSLQVNDGLEVDHVNHNGLDNRRCNLRICTTSENQRNKRSQRNAVSSFKGVSFHKRDKKWQVRICVNKKNEFVGNYRTEIEAAKAYDLKAISLHGTFACLNFPLQSSVI